PSGERKLNGRTFRVSVGCPKGGGNRCAGRPAKWMSGQPGTRSMHARATDGCLPRTLPTSWPPRPGTTTANTSAYPGRNDGERDPGDPRHARLAHAAGAAIAPLETIES